MNLNGEPAFCPSAATLAATDQLAAAVRDTLANVAAVHAAITAREQALEADHQRAAEYCRQMSPDAERIVYGDLMAAADDWAMCDVLDELRGHVLELRALMGG